jgi:hypothetical protein
MKPNDKVRLRQYPNVVGTFVAYTKIHKSCIVHFEFSGDHRLGTYVDVDQIEPVPPTYTWDDVKDGDLVTVTSGCGTRHIFIAHPSVQDVWANWAILNIKRPVTTYDVVKPSGVVRPADQATLEAAYGPRRGAR